MNDPNHGSSSTCIALRHLFGDNACRLMLSVLVFLAAGTLAFAVMIGVRAREAVRRRAARVGVDDDASGGRRSLRYSGLQDRAASSSTIRPSITPRPTANDIKVLRRRLIAGRHLRSARRGLFLHGPHGAGGRSCRRGVLRPADARARRQDVVLAVCGLRRTCSAIWCRAFISTAGSKARRLEHQAGFPDFMDLLVVCADAGLSMEAALDRVGRELGDSYPVARPPISTWPISKSAPAAP